MAGDEPPARSPSEAGGSRAVPELAPLRTLIHDLRSPVIAARHLVEELRSGPLTDDERAVVLSRIASCLASIDEITLRAFSLQRLEKELAAAPPAELDLSEVVVRAVSRADLPVTPQVEISAGPHIVVGHHDAIERAVDHLLRNAVDHTPLGTEVEVRVFPDGRSTVIAVDDHGPGIPDPLKERIFAPFDRGTASAHRGGLGLGLALVARTAAAHGGRAWVEDLPPHGGSSFRIALPGRGRP